MSSANVYMGPRGNLVAVPAPAASPDYTPIGWNSKTQYLNGGIGVKTSYATHKEYALTWNATSRERLRPVLDIYSGMLGTGLVYYCDPVAFDANVLPQAWAWPALASLDGPVLVFPSSGSVQPAAPSGYIYAGGSSTPSTPPLGYAYPINATVPPILVSNDITRPTAIATPANTLGYPATSVAYAAGVSTSLFVPIPAGYVLWFGWHGSGTGGVTITPAVSALVSAAAVTPAALAVTDANRFNASFSSASYVGVDITLTGGGPTLSGLMAQLLPIGTTPTAGGFISGQGNSGCAFEAAPTMTPYSAAPGLDLVGMSGKLIETGSWL